MRPLLASLLLAATIPFASVTALAQVHVPGDYATIQAAINSGNALIYVGAGNWYETLSIDHTVTLLPEPPADARQPTPFPRVTGMSIVRNSTDYPTVIVRGFHFTNTVTQTNGYLRYGITTIEGCKLDAGFNSLGSSGVTDAIKIRSCVITGDVYVYSYYNEFTGNFVWKGQVDVHSNGGNGALIRDNIVLGPSDVGVMSTSGDTDGLVENNTVVGTTVGYRLAYGTASTNSATDCVTGYADIDGGGGRTFFGNTALRCDVGIDLSAIHGSSTISSNSIDSSTTIGIHTASGVTSTCTSNIVEHAGSVGIWLEGSGKPTSNLVLNSGGTGIQSVSRAEQNTVGRSAGHGIIGPGARKNTVYLNSGSGIYANSSSPDTVDHNIVYGNGAYGLAYVGSGGLVLSCNDWYNNVHGATYHVSPAASDLAADPLFCNLPLDNVYLSSSSPCANPVGCGRIGARVVACSAPTDAPPADDADVRFSVRPNPTQGEVAMRWARSPDPSVIEVFDLTGALRFRTALPVGATSFVWRGEDGTHGALRGGVYFVRRTAGAVVEHARVVITP